MHHADTLVSIGLPVRNGAGRMECVVESVLAQDHKNLELIICDNASTDDTEALCRGFAARDSRVIYHRNPVNVGILNNFLGAMRLATGEYFRWVGDDDWLDPRSLSRCLEAFAADDRLILVTNRLEYVEPDGRTKAMSYAGTAWGSDDPVTRFAEVLRLLSEPHFPVDPLYALFRREAMMHIKRRNMLNEDQVFATKLALAGPWGHVDEVTFRRSWKPESLPVLARKLDVPRWQAHFANTLQCIEMLRCLNEFDLDPKQLARGRLAVARMYLRRQLMVVIHRSRKLLRLAWKFARSRSES